MKAVVLKDFGGVENLLLTDLPEPQTGDQDVLIKVKAIGLNPVDYKTRMGKSQASRLKEFSPIILGWDISGTVIHKGKATCRFREGDEVFGMVNFPGHGRAYAEYVAAPEVHLSHKPKNISHAEAAGATLAALTAWQIFKEIIKIRPGDKILIHAAAGGVGHYAVQMARHLGAEVIGTASSANREFIRKMGAVGFIDYEKLKFEDILRDMDWVFDGIGGEYTDRSLKVLKPGGTIVVLPSGSSEGVTEKAKAKGMNGFTFRVRSDGNDMQEIADMLEKGIIKTYVSGTYKLEEIQAAHRQLESGKTKGKLVVLLD